MLPLWGFYILAGGVVLVIHSILAWENKISPFPSEWIERKIVLGVCTVSGFSIAFQLIALERLGYGRLWWLVLAELPLYLLAAVPYLKVSRDLRQESEQKINETKAEL